MGKGKMRCRRREISMGILRFFFLDSKVDVQVANEACGKSQHGVKPMDVLRRRH